MTGEPRRARVRTAIADLEESLIRQVANAHMDGAHLIPLWFGEPDRPTPDFIKQAAVRALREDRVFYAQNRGVPPLVEAIAEYATRLHGRPVDAGRLTVTASGMNAIMLVSEALIAAGDNMVVVAPVWPNCRETVRIMGGEVRVVALRADAEERWRLDLDELLARCDGRTRGVFVNSPGNPTGWVMSAEEQAALLAACRERGIFIVADEVYVRLHYELPRAPSFLDIAADDDPVIVINSFSKSWSMTGWRLGWLTHPPDLGETFGKLNEYNIAGPTTFVQHAGVTAVRDGEAFVQALVERYRRNRDLVFQRLAALPRVRLARPEGAFYAFFAVDGMTDSVAFAREVIARSGVGLAPGRAFGPEGEGRLRLCFAAEPETLSRALDRMAPVLG